MRRHVVLVPLLLSVALCAGCAVSEVAAPASARPSPTGTSAVFPVVPRSSALHPPAPVTPDCREHVIGRGWIEVAPARCALAAAPLDVAGPA